MSNLITVREHARLTTAEVPASAVNAARVSETVFDWLLSESARLLGTGKGLRLVELENRRELRLDNYVGVLEAPCGTRIEILPKALDAGDERASSRDLLQRMLLRCLGIKPRQSGPTTLRTFDAPLSEWVAAQFLESVDHLVKRGLRFEYHPVEEELRYLRGRLIVAKQLRQSPARRHYFQVEHDVFDADRAENRLLRLALDVVRKRTREPRNWRLAHELAHHLDEIPPSTNIHEDFRQWSEERLMAHYGPVRMWSSLILHEQMPLSIVGDYRGLSLLFPMEQVYEQYVGASLKTAMPQGCQLVSQASRRHLCAHAPVGTTEPRGWFELRPDFLVTKAAQHKVVLDAKWKLLDAARNDSESKYDLSQGDFYQLYAYGQKYLDGQGNLILLYPKTANFSEPLPPFDFGHGLQLHVLPFDLSKDRQDWGLEKFLGDRGTIFA